MFRLLDNTRISAYAMMYMLLLVICAGGATVFARNLGNPLTFSNFVVIVCTIYFAYIKGVRVNKSFIVVVLVFTLYALITAVNNSRLSLMWMAQWYIWLSIAYVICKVYLFRLFVVYETAVYFLCVISLVFWFGQLLNPKLIENLVEITSLSSPYATDCNVKVNNFLFTVNRRADVLNEYTFVIRNAGFAWEPGAFASFICLGLFCNLMRTNFRIVNNRSLYVLLISLLSTQSTTGFVIFIFLLGAHMIMNGKYSYVIWILPLIIGLFCLPFVRDKVLNEMQLTSNFDIRNLGDGTYSLGRMASFKLYWMEFLRHPILGLGGYAGGTELQARGYDNVALISGIGQIFAMYGIVVSCLFFTCLYRTSILLEKIFSRNGLLVFIPILGMMFSYALWVHPVYISFWLFSVLIHRD